MKKAGGERERGENVDKFSLIILDEPTKMPLWRSIVWEKLALVANLSTIVALRTATKCFDSVNAKLCKLGEEGTRVDITFTLRVLINSTRKNEFQKCASEGGHPRKFLCLRIFGSSLFWSTNYFEWQLFVIVETVIIKATIYMLRYIRYAAKNFGYILHLDTYLIISKRKI